MLTGSLIDSKQNTLLRGTLGLRSDKSDDSTMACPFVFEWNALLSVRSAITGCA